MKVLTLTFAGTDLKLRERIVPFVIKPLVVLFIYFGLYSRFSGFFGFTGGMTAAALSGLLFLVCCFHLFFINEKKGISHLASLTCIFFIFIALVPLISAFIFNERTGLIARYFIEVLIIFFIFFSFYYVIKAGLVSPKFFLYCIAILGVLAAVQMLSNLIGRSMVMRLGGLGGLNYTGNSYAVSSMIFIMILYAGNQGRFMKILTVLGLMAVFLAMLLTGTRAAVIAFVLGIFLLQAFGMKSRNFGKYLLIVGGLLLIPVIYIAANVDLTLLLSRYSFDNLAYMANLRLSIYAGSVTDMTLPEFFFGRPDLYAYDDRLFEGERFVNTHNAFLSLIRFNGIFAFMLFVAILAALFYSFYKVYLRHRKNVSYRLTESSIIVFLVISLVYVSLSGGKITRSFYMYIVLGYVVGYFDLLSSVSSPKEYMKMILRVR